MSSKFQAAMDREAAASHMASRGATSPDLWAADAKRGEEFLKLLQEAQSFTPEQALARLWAQRRQRDAYGGSVCADGQEK